ncbi:MAG TPA: hypothetical protein ENN13_04155 [Candidatus Altiarchaeales archaeon]|nr:hypothetical protein [Candidatus Altiarchaeales archaeon]
MGASGKQDFVIQNARTLYSDKTLDILVSNGLIAQTGSKLEAGDSYDAQGRIVAPGFVNIHTHLDKADLLSLMKPSDFGKSLEENRELLKKFKKNYTVKNVKERAKKVALEMLANGCTAIRTQVDVDSTCGLTSLKALTELKDELKQCVTLQTCAFPQQGVVEEKSRALIEEALKEGADLLGGLPLVEKGEEAQLQHIDILFELAKKYGVDLEVQIDESNDPRNFMLPILAEKTIENKMQGRVSATHCISLSAQSEQVAKETIKLVKQAGINVIVTPSANMITRFNLPDDVHSRPSNSITLVKELAEAGVNVAMGTDNIRDIFYPLGNSSMLREMHVLASATRMTRDKDPQLLTEMASINGAKIMGLNHGLEKGAPADLIVLNAKTPNEILNRTPIIPKIFKAGTPVSETVLDQNVRCLA